MSAILPADIVVDLERAMTGCPPDRCLRMLWRTTDLLVAGRDRLREQEIDALDEVLLRLCEHIQPWVLAKLSAALAELANAPKATLRRLVLHDDPSIAGPLLLKSEAITAADLDTVATSRSEQHLLAIAARRKVGEALTEVLLQRGSRSLCHALARNPGAAFSEAGHALLLAKAQGDGELGKALALRPDLPETTLRALDSNARKEIKLPLLDAIPHTMRDRIGAQGPTTKSRTAIDYSEARSEITALSRIGKLNDSAVNRFAIRGEMANLIVSLSVLSGAPIEIIERVMADQGYEGLVMACRASRLNWQTALAILAKRGGPQLSSTERVRAHELFETQHLSTSQWTVRWGDMGASGEATNGNAARTGATR